MTEKEQLTREELLEELRILLENPEIITCEECEDREDCKHRENKPAE